MSTAAAPTRIITRTLDIQNAVEPLNSFQICRGDTVQFNLTFMRGAEELDYTGYTLRVFAKAVNRDGIVSPEADPLFSYEGNFASTFTIGSTQTAGAAGPYLLTVIVLDTSLTIPQTITTQCIYFDLLENGYAGVYQPGQ
ncbi:MAG: hypothetical protein IKO42_00890, partial [Opitutales bacterium]|nr:hypothetical protein [Opitutales bacterium]